MFEPTSKPRLFALPPGADFAQALVDGLRTRMQGQPPHAMARVTLVLNTTRMVRRVRQVFAQGPAGFVPRIRLLTDLADPRDLAELPAPVSSLRRRLELVELLGKLLEADKTLAPRSSLFDLADSLATLMEEMQVEGIAPDVIEGLNVEDQSGHWQRALTFIRIAQRYFDLTGEPPDGNALYRQAMMRLMDRWQAEPPKDPIILAGSTGSRGTTALLMKAVACLPQGGVVLPGFDTDTPQYVWESLTNALTGEDHPQFRFARLMQDLSLTAGDVPLWCDIAAPAPQRNAVLSLALRPAPVTHQWLNEGPHLPMIDGAMLGVTLLEAPSKRDEALCIAMRLRQAAEDGVRAALITPDRMLTRQVSAALARWDIVADDSAGTPYQLTPPGRFLRHVAQVMRQDLTAETLLTILKHPLCHSGAGRGQHLLNTRDLELHIRRYGWPFPQADKIRDWANARDAAAWGEWVVACFCRGVQAGERPLADWITLQTELAEAMAAGSESDDHSELWAKAEGREVRRLTDEFLQEAEHGGVLDIADYSDLMGAILSRGQVRNPDTPHPDILIWGTLEARVMDADLLILGSLNEGSWPEIPGADPWLNRKMRHDAGLLLPERRIGLAAHDFQQAFGAKEVWLTRAQKSDDAETVPARWLNRLTNLMRGLPMRNGPDALAQMTGRGAQWLAMARLIEAPVFAPKAHRPSPCPPVHARPARISVTDVQKLIRDPYAIYAKHVLRLRPLDPLQKVPDALLRGTILHTVFERFIKETRDAPDTISARRLEQLASEVLTEAVPWPSMRPVWQSRINRISDWFAVREQARRDISQPVHFEIQGNAAIDRLGFTLTGKADRIDIDARGVAQIYDYKTGTPPSKQQQIEYDKQLLIEAAMIERGAFTDLGALAVDRAIFIGLGSKPAEVDAPLDELPAATVWEQFEALIEAYQQPERGFTARRSMFKEDDFADYDHLARFGEWDPTQDAVPEVLE